MRLSLPEHLDWLVLRRVRRGGVTRFKGGYQDNGQPLGLILIDILDLLDEQDLLEVADPDESGSRRLALNEAGWDRYRELCRRQRRPKPSPEPDSDTTKTPAGRRSSAPRSGAPGDHGGLGGIRR